MVFYYNFIDSQPVVFCSSVTDGERVTTITLMVLTVRPLSPPHCMLYIPAVLSVTIVV